MRDSATVSRFLAQQLRNRGLEDFTVVQLAQAGYNITQEIATVGEWLRRGSRPRAIVFFHGLNEVAPYEEGEPLWAPYGYRQVAERIELGKRDFAAEALGLARHLAFVQRLRGAVSQPEPADRLPDDEVCRSVTDWYRYHSGQIVSLGQRYRFVPLLVWQPTLARTGKKLARYEQFRLEWEQRHHPKLNPLLRDCSLMVDSAMAASSEAQYYHPLHGMFDGDTGEVFMDGHGHMTERAHLAVGDTLAALVMSRWASAGATIPAE